MSNWNVSTENIINSFIKNYIFNFYDIKNPVINIYRRDINNTGYMSKNTTDVKCTIDKVRVDSLTNYELLDNMDVNITVDKSGNLIAKFEIAGITDFAIFPIINIKRI